MRDNPEIASALPELRRILSIVNGVTTVDIDTMVYPADYGQYANYRRYMSTNSPLVPDAKGKMRGVLKVRKYTQNYHWVDQDRFYGGSPHHSEVQEYHLVYGVPTTVATYTVSEPQFMRFFRRSTSDGEMEFGLLEESDRRAVSTLCKKVGEMKLHVGVLFAERKMTSNMVVNNLARVVTAANAVRHGQWRHALDALSIDPTSSAARNYMRRVARTPADRRLANHWLELQFGWLPLLEDIYGGLEVLKEHIGNNSAGFYHDSVTAGASVSDRWSQRVPFGSMGNNDFVVARRQTRYKINYRLDSFARAALQQTGVSNPLLLAWDILPYSFVVDWFLPVGQYLKNLQAFDGFDFVSGTKSVRSTNSAMRFTAGSVVAEPVGGGLYQNGSTSGNASATHFTYERKVLNAFPRQDFPKLRNPMGNGPVWKFVTSFALLRQVFGR